MGDKIKVKVDEIDAQGRINLILDQEVEVPVSAQMPESGYRPGGREPAREGSGDRDRGGSREGGRDRDGRGGPPRSRNGGGGGGGGGGFRGGRR